MKLKFIATAKGRDWKVGDVQDFKTGIELAYAKKYIERGWAEEVQFGNASRPAAVPLQTGTDKAADNK